MRTDTYNGNTIYTVLTDYQGVTNGGNGWLRNFTFSPTNNTITLSSYSPYIPQSNYSAPTVLPYTMSATSNLRADRHKHQRCIGNNNQYYVAFTLQFHRIRMVCHCKQWNHHHNRPNMDVHNRNRYTINVGHLLQDGCIMLRSQHRISCRRYCH